VLLFLLLLAAACRRADAPASIAFYHWQSEIRISAQERAFLADLDAERLYVKYLDVDLEAGEAVPKAGLRLADSSYRQYDIVPCVFITNRTFQAGTSPEELAEKVWAYLQQVNQEAGLVPQAYQFDCDWSLTTRDAYFDFLRAIGQRAGQANLSATIRLHQYRYPEQTGVPPVDHGCLMYYNMGDIEDVKEPNSLLNTETAARYLEGAGTYELPLDLALPLFSWVLVYRFGELYRILPEPDLNALAQMPELEKTAPGRYRVQQNVYFGGHYLNRGDRLRLEVPSRQALRKAAQQLNKIENNRGTLLFYHLQPSILQRYPVSFLRELAAAVGQR